MISFYVELGCGELGLGLGRGRRLRLLVVLAEDHVPELWAVADEALSRQRQPEIAEVTARGRIRTITTSTAIRAMMMSFMRCPDV